ncbi:hypothetical protein ZIOFF_051140 [Zingiber officinale]|uniref:FAE domain-containing protein n=1 Tax=Zingiber officinale TaxID=94328 RepID=A0A8J5KQU4_ZINOF|nr:hypothetical protein ZIOFF_051140 [Zingiber officinale]
MEEKQASSFKPYANLAYCYFIVSMLLSLASVAMTPAKLEWLLELCFRWGNRVHRGQLLLLLLLVPFSMMLMYLAMRRPLAVYLVDFACHLPPPEFKISFNELEELSIPCGKYDEETIAFQLKVLARSGLGDEAYIPPTLHQVPPCPSMAAAREREEKQQVVFSALDSLFARTALDPCDVNVHVVNCSRFNPTPSISSMIVNHYSLRSNIRTFNLSGVGCRAGLIAVHLARDLLKVS